MAKDRLVKIKYSVTQNNLAKHVQKTMWMGEDEFKNFVAHAVALGHCTEHYDANNNLIKENHYEVLRERDVKPVSSKLINPQEEIEALKEQMAELLKATSETKEEVKEVEKPKQTRTRKSNKSNH